MLKTRIKTLASGKRVRQTIAGNGRVVATKELPKARPNKTRQRLAKKRRRIGR